MASTGRPTAGHAASAAAGRQRRGALRGLKLIPILFLASVLTGLTVLASVVPAAAATDSERLEEGHDLLITYCGSCHATDRTGASPRPDAPAFRVLGQRYPIESLEESLGEGMMSGHPDMPEMSFDSDDVGAIVDYLKSIQVR